MDDNNVDMMTDLSKEKVRCHWNGTIYFVEPRIFREVLFMQENGPRRFVRPEEACEIYAVSMNTLNKLAVRAEASHKEDGTRFIDLHRLNKYIESI